MTGWHSLTEELDCWADQGLSATLWWRDDDAALPDPALDRLLGLSRTPLALAVIPETVHGEAAGAILARSTATVIQHGYAHRNHEPEGIRKCEFGAQQDMDDALDDLVTGRRQVDGSAVKPHRRHVGHVVAGHLHRRLAGGERRSSDL